LRGPQCLKLLRGGMQFELRADGCLHRTSILPLQQQVKENVLDEEIVLYGQGVHAHHAPKGTPHSSPC